MLFRSETETDNGSLLILTRGIQAELENRPVYKMEGDTPVATGETTVAPMKNGEVSAGVYAISFTANQQAISSPSLRFVGENFYPGAILQPIVSFANSGTAAIRGSADKPISIKLMLSGTTNSVLAEWKVAGNILPGQSVNTLRYMGDVITESLPLPEQVAGKKLYFSVEEHHQSAGSYLSRGYEAQKIWGKGCKSPKCGCRYALPIMWASHH